ncbi:uncharacterized protein LOC142181896 [Nicotiana tabacum]|uniref:Uncharacterized protein LOC142181896 n=1 Tax=Nicotiana tabacum TaxID=4097 RepID=A0AC58UQ79_TOBAC
MASLHSAINLSVELLTEKENVTKVKIPISIKWSKPPSGHIKLNIDGSFKQALSLCGFGGVFRDNKAQWIVGFHGNLPGITRLQAELMSLKTGLQIAKRQGFTKLDVETVSGGSLG